MKAETRIREKRFVRVCCFGSFVTVLVLQARVPTATAAEPLTQPSQVVSTSAHAAAGREIVEEAFAAHAAKMTADKADSGLSTSIEFAAREARMVRLVIRRPYAGQPCLDELEVYGPDSQSNLALWPAAARCPARRPCCPAMPSMRSPT